MFDKINKKKLAGVILAGVITVTGATSAFAADQAGNNQQVVTQNKPSKMDFSKMSTAIKSAIDSLVTAGTITQEQADAVAKVYTPGKGKGDLLKARKNPFDELVAAGTITQAQADAISAAIKTGRESKKTTADITKELVTAGTITQAQSDAVAKIFTPGERKGEFLGGRKNPMDELVTVGTITQAQADAINTATKAGRESKKTTEDTLKELVTAGTITQAQSDAVAKVFTPGERRGDFKGVRMNPLDELVTAKTITQAQADAVNTATKTGRESKKSTEDVLKELVTVGTITQAQSDAVAKVCTHGERRGEFNGVVKNPLDELVTAGTITQTQADAINTAVKSVLGSLKKQ